MDSQEIRRPRIDVPRPYASRWDARQRPLLHALQEHRRQIRYMCIEQMYQIIKEKSLLRNRFFGDMSRFFAIH